MTTPSKSNGTPSKQRRTPAKQTPGSTQRTRTASLSRRVDTTEVVLLLAAKKRNPLMALQEDEPVAVSPAPSSVQMPFTPGRTPNKNRGLSLSSSNRDRQRKSSLLSRHGFLSDDLHHVTCTQQYVWQWSNTHVHSVTSTI